MTNHLWKYCKTLEVKKSRRLGDRIFGYSTKYHTINIVDIHRDSFIRWRPAYPRRWDPRSPQGYQD